MVESVPQGSAGGPAGLPCKRDEPEENSMWIYSALLYRSPHRIPDRNAGRARAACMVQDRPPTKLNEILCSFVATVCIDGDIEMVQTARQLKQSEAGRLLDWKASDQSPRMRNPRIHTRILCSCSQCLATQQWYSLWPASGPVLIEHATAARISGRDTRDSCAHARVGAGQRPSTSDVFSTRRAWHTDRAAMTTLTDRPRDGETTWAIRQRG